MFTFKEVFDIVSEDVVEESGEEEGEGPAGNSDHIWKL